MKGIIIGLSRSKSAMESDFFNSVVREFGINEEQSYFVTPNFRYELVEIQPALCGDGSTDGTVVATYFLGYVARADFGIARHPFELEQTQHLNVDLRHSLRTEVGSVGFRHWCLDYHLC